MENMLKVSCVTKEYKLGQIGSTTLRDELQRWNAKRRHMEDPTKRIGSEDYIPGETFKALDNVSFEVKKGERVGIIGRNGAGKSTLLKLISRITAPTSGLIGLNGRIASMLEVGTGFHGELTGRENIYMNGAILGMKKKEIDEKIEEIIEFSECRKFIDTPVKRYSSGMYVKLAFSVAAHLDAEIMIMDEVLAVGDMSFQKKCLSKMNAVSREEGRTILYVSHNMNTIRELCDRCIVLDHGKVIFDGDTEKAIEIYSENKLNVNTSMDYAGEPFPRWLTTPKLKLMTAAYVGKKNILFEKGERINILLTWKNLQDIENACLRVEIQTLNEIRIATYVAYDFYSGKKDAVAELELELNPEVFVEGSYYMTYTFFEHDALGNMTNIECKPGLCFEIISARHTGKLNWQAVHWGYLELDEIKVVHITEK